MAFGGAHHDPVAALVFCTPSSVAYSIINGKVVVREGHCVTVETGNVLERHNILARRLLEAAH
jgi:hypothetical protein